MNIAEKELNKGIETDDIDKIYRYSRINNLLTRYNLTDSKVIDMFKNLSPESLYDLKNKGFVLTKREQDILYDYYSKDL